MSNVTSYEFNVWDLKHYANEQETFVLVNHLMLKHNLFISLKIEPQEFLNFSKEIQDGYQVVPYHNKTHAADVCQTCYYFCTDLNMIEIAKLDDLDLASMLIGGIIHDYNHPGLNNVFLKETVHPLSIKYNDQSILENHHVASAYSLIQKSDNNFMREMQRDEYKKMRERLIQMVLATDMAKHFADIAKFKGRAGAEDFEPFGSDKIFCMS